MMQLTLFGVVGAGGVLVNTGVLWVLHTVLRLHYLLSAAAATETAITHNFFGNEFLTFAHQGRSVPRWRRFVSFQAISLTTLLGTLTILWTLVHLFGEGRLLLWNLLAIGVMFLVNFGLNRSLTWRAVARGR